MLADPSQEAPPSPHAEPASSLSCGLDRLMLDVDGGDKGHANGSASAEKPAARISCASPLSTRVPVAPVAVVEATSTRQGTAALEAAAAAAAAATASSLPIPEEPKPRGTLVVSPPPTTSAAAAQVPVVTLSSKSPPTRTRKTGSKKMSARKLGAMKLGGGNAVQLSSMPDVPAEGPSVVGAGSETKAADRGASDPEIALKLQKEENMATPSSRLAAAAASATLGTSSSSAKMNGSSDTASGGSIYRSVNDSTGGYGYRGGSTLGSTTVGSNAGLSSFSYGSGGSDGANGGGSGSSFDKDKYKNVKGIGSDMIFGVQDDDPAEQAMRAMKAQEFHGSSAISSDMYFDRESETANSDGRGRLGLGDVAEQIAMTAATEFQGASEAAAKLKVRT